MLITLIVVDEDSIEVKKAKSTVDKYKEIICLHVITLSRYDTELKNTHVHTIMKMQNYIECNYNLACFVFLLLLVPLEL